MSLDQRIQIWLGNIKDPSPIPEPYRDVPSNPMKRRRADSPPRETRKTLQLQPGEPGYNPKKKWAKYPPHIEKIMVDMVRSTSYRTPKKRATANNRVSSESQQQYCNVLSYATGKSERWPIKRRVEPVLEPATTPSRVSSAPTWEHLLQREVKVEPDTEPRLWPRDVKVEPVTEPVPPQWPRRIKVEPVIEPPPTTLTILLKRINNIYAGRGILPSNFRPIMYATSPIPTYKDMAWARGGHESDVHYCPQRDEYGHIPGPADIAKIMYQTAFCTKAQALPSEWNMEVVQRVLELTLRDEYISGPQSVDFRYSADGVIIPEYHTNPGIPQPPDFCVYIEPTCDKEPIPPRIITDVQKKLYRNTLNHIDLRSLQQRPIAFHIHTLPQNTNLELQRVKTSFAAHRGFLKRLVRLRERADAYSAGWGSVDSSTYDLPEFLPGIIIYKHNWFLSILKADEENARFYGIGDTATSMGVYKIVYALQILQNWAKTEYWPWMQRLILKWPCDRYGKMV